MNSSILPSKVLILVLAACLFWIGLLSLAFTAIAGFTVSSGWLLAGAMVFSTVAWVLVMIREMANAIDFPDDFESEGQIFKKFDGSNDMEDVIPLFPAPNDRKPSRNQANQGIEPRRGRPRKARSTATTPPAGSFHPEFFHPDI